MPTKLNKAGNQQNYVPAGNGDSSGEYGDNASGSNKHFKAFKKPDYQLGSSTSKSETLKSTKKIKDYAIKDIEDNTKNGFYNLKDKKDMDLMKEGVLQDLVIDGVINEDEKKDYKSEIESIIEEYIGKQQEDIIDPKDLDFEKVDAIKSKDKKLVDKMSSEECKNFLFNYVDEFDKNKIEALSEEQLKDLVIAKINSELKNKNSANNKYSKLAKEINDEGYKLWYANPPKKYEDFINSLEDKKQFFETQYNINHLGETNEDSPTWIKLKLEHYNKAQDKINKYDELVNSWKEEKALDDNYNSLIEKSKKIIEQFENPNNLYSQKSKDNALWYKSYESSLKEYTKWFENVKENLSDNELGWVKHYTSSYSFINEPLRKINYTGSKAVSNDFVEAVSSITTAIDKSQIPKNIWLQRGVNNLDVNGLNISNMTKSELDGMVGKTFKDQGFCSASSHKGAAFSEKGIIMNIYCPKGTKALYVNPISHYKGSSEDETIIQRGYTYKITKVEKVGGKTYLDCEVVLGTDEEKYNTQDLNELKNKHFVGGY